MTTVPSRIVIYSKDVMNITGHKIRTAQKLLAKIRRQLQKPPRSLVSIDEFCNCTGFPEERVKSFLK